MTDRELTVVMSICAPSLPFDERFGETVVTDSELTVVNVGSVHVAACHTMSIW